MDWFSPENIVTVIVGVLSLAAPIGGAWAWYQRRASRRRRVGHRVQMDAAIGRDRGDGQGQPTVRQGLFDELPVRSDATLVLLRVENNGSDSIGVDDYNNLNHGFAVTFTERTIRSVEVIPQPKAEALLDHFVPVDGKGGMQYEGNTIHLPRVPLNQGRYFKLLVLLNGGAVGSKIDVIGDIRDGEVRRTQSRTVDDDPPPFSRLSLAITAMLVCCVFVLLGLVVFRAPPPARVVTLRPPPIGCAQGQLRSSAPPPSRPS